MILPYACPCTAAASLRASLFDYPASLQYWAKDTKDLDYYASRTSVLRAAATKETAMKRFCYKGRTTPLLYRDFFGLLVFISFIKLTLSTSNESRHSLLTLDLPANAKELCLPSSAITLSLLSPSLI